jgi:exonuclease III
MASNINIVSLNCRGLRDIHKRKDVLNYLRQQKHNIYCLQDTHFVDADYNTIKAQWGYDCYISGGRRDARGVAILFNSNFEYKVLDTSRDQDGNYIILKIEVEKRFTIVLTNIYGPNRDSPGFYETVQQQILDMEGDYDVLCGDWNLVQDYNIDCYNYKHQNNPHARKAVLQLKNSLRLVDPWRVQNQETRRYTWSRKNPTKKARLDFFLISENIMTLLDRVDILPGYQTDHCMVILGLRLTNFEKGRGFWRFNNSLLKDLKFIKRVKEVIEETKEYYAVPVYNREQLREVPSETLQFTINDQLFFEMLLLNIRGMVIPYSARKKKENTGEESIHREAIKVISRVS